MLAGRYQDEVEAYLLENLEGVDMELLVGKLPDLIKQVHYRPAASPSFFSPPVKRQECLAFEDQSFSS